jgi:hypothetical protein
VTRDWTETAMWIVRALLAGMLLALALNLVSVEELRATWWPIPTTVIVLAMAVLIKRNVL